MGGKQSRPASARASAVSTSQQRASGKVDLSQAVLAIKTKKAEENYVEVDEVEEPIMPPEYKAAPKKVKGKAAALAHVIEGAYAATIQKGSFSLKCLALTMKRPKAADEDQEALLALIEMAQLADPHVVKLLGFHSTPKILTTVFDEVSSSVLDYVLGQKRSASEKMKILWHIADGMAAVEDLGAYHGALCARNCFVADGGSAFKVGPWGLSRASMHPIYLAPEALSNSAAVLTSQSDAYSFAVLCVEVFADGDLGLAKFTDFAHWREKVQEGDFQVSVEGTPDGVQKTLLQCLGDVSQRPDFSWLQAEFHDKYDEAAAS